MTRWTQKELIEEFQPELVKQAKFYNPEQEWAQGAELFPNFPVERGEYRLVIFFDKGFIPRSSQEAEIDPKPRPWIVGVIKKGSDKLHSTYGGWGKDNYFETYAEATRRFLEVRKEINLAIKESGLTKESPRQAQCSTCNRIHDYKPSSSVGYDGMASFSPERKYDIVYDGCRGWD